MVQDGNMNDNNMFLFIMHEWIFFEFRSNESEKYSNPLINGKIEILLIKKNKCVILPNTYLETK